MTTKHQLSDAEDVDVDVDVDTSEMYHLTDVLPLNALKSRATIRSCLIKAPSRSFVNTSTSVDTECQEGVTWAISARGLLRLLLHELQSSSKNGIASGNGNTQYRLGVARALANLPWSNEALGSQYFACVAEMLQLAEVNLTGAIPDNSSDTDTDMEKEKDMAVEKEKEKGKGKKSASRVPGKNANGSVMFGGRYANHVPASAQPMTKRRTVVGSSRPRSENDATTTNDPIANKKINCFIIYVGEGGRLLVSASAPQERWGALDRASKSLGRTSERHMA